MFVFVAFLFYHSMSAFYLLLMFQLAVFCYREDWQVCQNVSVLETENKIQQEGTLSFMSFFYTVHSAPLYVPFVLLLLGTTVNSHLSDLQLVWGYHRSSFVRIFPLLPAPIFHPDGFLNMSKCKFVLTICFFLSFCIC